MATVESISKSSSPASFFPVTSLPPEIRSRIFYFALLPDSPLTLPTIKTSAPAYHSLQLVSQLFHNETQVLPYYCFPLVLPSIFGSNATSTLKTLGALKPWQINAIRKVELCFLGSVYDASEAGRVLRFLKNGSDIDDDSKDMASGRPADKGLSLDAVLSFEDEAPRRSTGEGDQHRTDANNDESRSQSELRELTIKMTARDIMTPFAESAVGMEKVLDLETSPFFIELFDGIGNGRFNGLRRISVTVELGASLREEYDKEWVRGWKFELQRKLNARKVKVEVDFHHLLSDVCVMQGYYAALAGDESFWGIGYDTLIAMMSISAPTGGPVPVGFGRLYQ